MKRKNKLPWESFTSLHTCGLLSTSLDGKLKRNSPVAITSVFHLCISSFPALLRLYHFFSTSSLCLLSSGKAALISAVICSHVFFLSIAVHFLLKLLFSIVLLFCSTNWRRKRMASLLQFCFLLFLGFSQSIFSGRHRWGEGRQAAVGQKGSGASRRRCRWAPNSWACPHAQNSRQKLWRSNDVDCTYENS